MLRQILLHALPFLLPFIVYIGYVLLVRRAAAKGKVWANAPWYWLVASGLVLVIASFIALPLFRGDQPSGVYVPPRVENGVVVPGHFE